MKYFKRISIFATIILTVICLARSSEVKATSAKDLKDMWYETHYYPMNPESDEWFDYGLEEMFDILNPPEDLLHSFSTEELAELMMDYPYLSVLTTYEFDKMDIFFGFIENCDIYNELMRRDDGVLCLLKEYQNSDFDVNLCNEDPYMVWGYNPMANAEVFGCQFIVYNINDFDKEEYDLCCQVMREKTDLYSALNDNIAKDYLSFVKEKATVEEMKERWYNPLYFNWDYEGRRKYDMLDNLDILNPPPDLLLSMSTEELAKFMQEHPLMEQIITYFNIDGTQDYDTYFRFLEMFSDVFYELLRREDGITCLLQEYRTHKLNVQHLNEWGTVTIKQMWYAELIGCQFIHYYAHHFTENEYELASQIIEEKKELYSQLDDRFLNSLNLSEIEPPTGEEESRIRTNYLRPEEILIKENKLIAALLQVQLKDNSLPTVTPDTEENSLPTVTPDTEKNSIPTITPGTEDENNANQGKNNDNIVSEPDDKATAEDQEATTVDGETAVEDGRAAAEDVVATAELVGNESQQKVKLVVGALIGVVCVISGFVFIHRRRKGK